MHGTMMDYPLTITALMRHGRKVHANSRILTYRRPGDIAEATFAETADRADQLAAALQRLGVQPGDREIPKTSVGKFDKKVLRQPHADGELEITTI